MGKFAGLIAVRDNDPDHADAMLEPKPSAKIIFDSLLQLALEKKANLALHMGQ